MTSRAGRFFIGLVVGLRLAPLRETVRQHSPAERRERRARVARR